MDAVTTDLLTASLTLTTGTILYVTSRLFLEPIVETRRAIGEISFALSYHAHIYANPGKGTPDEIRQAAAELRRLGSLLAGRADSLLLYAPFSAFRWLPPRADCHEAWRKVILLSNFVHSGDWKENDQWRGAIEGAVW